MRCPRCGNENNPTNRFCGMCGATLLPAETPAGVPARGPAAHSSAPTPTQASAPPPVTTPQPAPRTSAPVSDESPAVSGPSFLGLNEPAPSKRSRGSLSIDPGSAPSSRSLDYLLEDDEEPRRGGAGKWILMFVALALAVGFGYLHWKDQGFSWLNSGTKKPAAATADAEDSAATPASAPGGTSASAPTPAPTANPPAAAAGSQPTTSSPAAASSGPPSSGTAPSSALSNTVASSPPATTPAPGSSAAPAPATKAATPAASTPAAADAGSPGSPTSAAAAATKDSSGDSSDAPAADADKPKPAPVVAAKPAPTVRPARTFDPVTEAQKYLYGKGVSQDCDRGLRILKPVADQSNPKAMVEMGALYSAGLCTPRDLPTAYRWFALALRKDPDNQAAQDDLQKLWGEMTQPERQLAIRLTQ